MYFINSTADNKMSFSLHICFLSFVRKYSTPCSYQSILNYIIIILLYYYSSTETQVRVVFDYTAQKSGERSIKVGDIMEVWSVKYTRKDGGRFVMILHICVCIHVHEHMAQLYTE